MTKWLGPDSGTFIAAGLLAAAAGYLELPPSAGAGWPGYGTDYLRVSYVRFSYVRAS